MNSLEDSACNQVAASRVGEAHGAYVGFAEMEEKAFSDVALRPEAVEGMRFGSHCFVLFRLSSSLPGVLLIADGSFRRRLFLNHGYSLSFVVAIVITVR